MKSENTVKLFGLNNISIESEIRRVEKKLDVDLGHRDRNAPKDDHTYYPQFSMKLRNEAEAMSGHYSIFYCLENSIRELVNDRLEEIHGETWWSTEGVVVQEVRKNAEKNQQKELSTGITPRSDDLLDYCNFGELGEIIKSNWPIFGDMFRDKKAVEKILGSLNTLRAPIAHCKILAEDEVLRLHLALRDWFRQMS
ncbi:Swt1 family HEPN domain-containing protein [Terasakiella sp.]|uniref:Swt1 family HEPN domain-containing protein n=1 Tax=Terasakiella sp. TaxID=2034861 RepID=UPI003AA81481